MHKKPTNQSFVARSQRRATTAGHPAAVLLSETYVCSLSTIRDQIYDLWHFQNIKLTVRYFQEFEHCYWMINYQSSIHRCV